jgi:hypothetical protein
MGNNISLEENDNEDQSHSNNDVEIKPVASNESGAGENSNNDTQQPVTVKKSKRVSSDILKKRRSTSKNTNVSLSKKTKSARRR